MNQKIVFFEWASCAGKTTIVDSLLSRHPNVFHVSKDQIKWLISNYSGKNQQHSKVLEKMLLDLTKTAIEDGFSVFIESQKKLISDILSFTEDKNVDIKYVNIEAPYNILLDRFRTRIKKAKLEWTNISNTSEEWFIERYNNYEEWKFIDGITLDTDKLSLDEAINRVEKYIK